MFSNRLEATAKRLDVRQVIYRIKIVADQIKFPR